MLNNLQKATKLQILQEVNLLIQNKFSNLLQIHQTPVTRDNAKTVDDLTYPSAILLMSLVILKGMLMGVTKSTLYSYLTSQSNRGYTNNIHILAAFSCFGLTEKRRNELDQANVDKYFSLVLFTHYILLSNPIIHGVTETHNQVEQTLLQLSGWILSNQLIPKITETLVDIRALASYLPRSSLKKFIHIKPKEVAIRAAVGLMPILAKSLTHQWDCPKKYVNERPSHLAYLGQDIIIQPASYSFILRFNDAMISKLARLGFNTQYLTRYEPAPAVRPPRPISPCYRPTTPVEMKPVPTESPESLNPNGSQIEFFVSSIRKQQEELTRNHSEIRDTISPVIPREINNVPTAAVTMDPENCPDPVPFQIPSRSDLTPLPATVEELIPPHSLSVNSLQQLDDEIFYSSSEGEN